MIRNANTEMTYAEELKLHKKEIIGEYKELESYVVKFLGSKSVCGRNVLQYVPPIDFGSSYIIIGTGYLIEVTHPSDDEVHKIYKVEVPYDILGKPAAYQHNRIRDLEQINPMFMYDVCNFFDSVLYESDDPDTWKHSAANIEEFVDANGIQQDSPLFYFVQHGIISANRMRKLLNKNTLNLHNDLQVAAAQARERKHTLKKESQA
jgi:hypothetical protein